MLRIVLLLLTFFVAALMAPPAAVAREHGHATHVAPSVPAAQPAATQPETAPVSALHGHPCPPSGPDHTCACPALCTAVLAVQTAAPARARPHLMPIFARADRAGIERLPPVPPPRG